MHALALLRIGVQLILRKIFGDGYRRLALLQRFEHLCHFSFQMKTVIENNVRIIQLLHIALRRFIQVGVYPRAHKSANLHILTANLSCDIRNHTRCRSDLQFPIVVCCLISAGRYQ
ncbi:hypothetical protein D3C78_1583740 [compost metagenome]